MSALALKQGLWSVGVLNPSLRIFDIVMEAKYGTSYNAYLLQGSEKTALIETTHIDYFEEYINNITSIVPLEDIDYLIMNHTEPDHSGSVAKLLELCPKLEIIATMAGKKHLGDIANKTLPCRAVKAGDTLDLGGRVLQFIPAPMLHWADSMFTWDEMGKTLFTCDFLGAHYCEPTMIDAKIQRKNAYLGELHNYYECIFGPFKPYVLAGLDKMPQGVEMACTSHGPVLTDLLEEVVAQYRQWSTPVPKGKKSASIIYASAYGCTQSMAEAAAKALEEDGFAVYLADVTEATVQEMAVHANEADVLLLGAPTINKDAPKPIWDVLSCVEAVNTKGRGAGAFGSYGWSGEAVPMVHTRLGQMRFAVPEAPLKWLFTPTEDDLKAMADYAREIASLVK